MILMGSPGCKLGIRAAHLLQHLIVDKVGLLLVIGLVGSLDLALLCASDQLLIAHGFLTSAL